ncbi:MAG: glutaredoxin [Verrucomicrobiota bacterium]
MKKQASIYRMVTPIHLCPWGIKAKDLLRRNGYEVADHLLESPEASHSYKEAHGYSETPQIFLEGSHLGGYDDLRTHLGLSPDPGEGTTYQPVVAVFAVTFGMAVATGWAMEQFSLIRVLELFVAFSMCVLGILKCQNLLSFSTGFVQYDLLARRYVPYSFVYPFIEVGAGILMIAGWATLIVAPVVLVVSTMGAISVIKAVYLEKRDLNCACVGGGSRVPLGFLSLSENLMMMTLAIWMMVRHLLPPS